MVHLDGRMPRRKGKYTMGKEWIVTQWIKDQLGIKNPAKEMARQNEIYGQALAEGFTEGIRNGLDKSDMSTMSSIKIDHTNWGKSITRDDHTIIDPLIQEFTDTVWAQQKKVLASGKYPHPIHKDNHTALEWIDHQMSEFADALVYHECLKQTIQDVKYLVHMASIKSDDPEVNAILDDILSRI